MPGRPVSTGGLSPPRLAPPAPPGPASLAAPAPPGPADGPPAGFVARLLPLCCFPEAAEISCAVSGGADSLALLVLAVAAAAPAGARVVVTHVDHGWRTGSAAEAEVVAAAAERFGASFRSERVRVAPGPNQEARARAARREVLPPGTCTGHTADDQAETVLLNLLRGAGLEGMAGIRPGPTKPLLALRRADTEALCEELGLEPLRDPSNDDLRFRRNRVRHELVPLLDAIAGRDVSGVIARQAALLHDDAELLAELAAPVDVSSAALLATRPLPVARMAVRRWLAPQLGHPPDAAAVERVLQVAAGQARACQVAGGLTVARTGGRLRVESRTGQ